MIKLKTILLEKKKMGDALLNSTYKRTGANQHTENRLILSRSMKNKKLEKFYKAMLELNDVFGGFGPELSKLNKTMEKELYASIQKTYSNANEVIGLL
jgi:hypothetical protein